MLEIEEVEKEGSHTQLEESSQSEEEEEESEGSHSAQESEETEREGSHTSSEESVESENEGPHSPEETEKESDVIELGDSSSSDNDARPQPDPEPIPEPEPTAFSQIPPVFYNDDAFKPRYTMEEINKSLHVLHDLPTKRVTFTRDENEVASEQAIEAKLKQGEIEVWVVMGSACRSGTGGEGGGDAAGAFVCGLATHLVHEEQAVEACGDGASRVAAVVVVVAAGGGERVFASESKEELCSGDCGEGEEGGEEGGEGGRDGV